MMKFNFTKRDIITVGIIIILLFLLKCSRDSNNKIDAELYLANYNLSALNDTVSTYRIGNGELISEKTSLVTTLKDLHKYNDSLADRIKYLAVELDAKPKFYIKYNTTIQHDTIEIDKSLTRLSETRYKVEFSHDTIYNLGNERHLAGTMYMNIDGEKVRLGQFTIDKDQMILDAEIIISEKDNKLVASVVSKYPGFNTSDIQSVVLDPKLHPALKKLNNKRYTIGPYIGLGLSPDMKISPQIGIGVSYKIIGF